MATAAAHNSGSRRAPVAAVRRCPPRATAAHAVKQWAARERSNGRGRTGREVGDMVEEVGGAAVAAVAAARAGTGVITTRWAGVAATAVAAAIGSGRSHIEGVVAGR